MVASFNIEGIAGMDLGALLDAGKDAVVTLVAGNTLLAAHRAVLAARSPVFSAMFRHDTLETSSGLVIIPDVEGPVLRQLLAYIYTLQAPQLPDMADQLLVAAEKYGLMGLKAACEQQMASRLTVESAAAAAVFALRHSCPSLRQAAVAFIKAHMHQVMMTQGWADAVVGHPMLTVELTRLIAEPPAETSTLADPAAAAASRPISGAQTHQLHSSHSQPPASAAPPMPPHHTPPPDNSAVSQMRSLSTQEKGRRLIEAATAGAVGKVQTLLAAGADIEARDEKGSTALRWASRQGYTVVVRRLLEAGAEVDTRSNSQNTAMHWAAQYGHAAVVRLLAASSADPNARNVDGWTPLHFAAYWGHTEAAAALLEAGADKKARDNFGDTPLDIALKENEQQLIDMLT